MKTLIVIAALALSQWAVAQKTVEIKEFSTLAVSGNIEVTLIKSSDSKVVIEEGEDTLDVGTDEGELALSNNNGQEAVVKVYHHGPINEIAVSGAVELKSADSIKSDNLVVAASGGTEVNIMIDAKKVTMAVASGAEMSISGTAKHFEANVASGAELKADKLKCESSAMVVSSGAEASVFVTGTVDATVASGGELTIHGNPKKVNEIKAGNAEIIMVK